MSQQTTGVAQAPRAAAEYCPLCGGRSMGTLERSSEVRVERCGQCDVAYVTPPPPVSELQEHYDEGYYAEWITSQARARRRLWRQRLAMVWAQRTGGDLLDVGCGDGSFLQMAQLAGFRCAGTELSAYAARRVRQHYGVPVTAGPLRSGNRPDGSFDVITMWHVLEHLIDPRGDLDEARRLLRPGGVLFVAVPNRSSRLFNLVYRVMKGAEPPLYTPQDKELHLFHFTSKSLRRLLESCGFIVQHVGLDVPDADWRKRWIDGAARAWFHLAGRNRTMAMCVIAKKPSEAAHAA